MTTEYAIVSTLPSSIVLPLHSFNFIYIFKARFDVWTCGLGGMIICFWLLCRLSVEQEHVDSVSTVVLSENALTCVEQERVDSCIEQEHVDSCVERCVESVSSDNMWTLCRVITCGLCVEW